MIEVLDFTPVQNNFLIGKFSICIEKWGNFIIRDICYFKKGRARWISFPSKRVIGTDKTYISYMEFKNPEMTKKFQEMALKSLDEYLKKNNYDVENLKQQEFEF